MQYAFLGMLMDMFAHARVCVCVCVCVCVRACVRVGMFMCLVRLQYFLWLRLIRCYFLFYQAASNKPPTGGESVCVCVH